MIPFHSPTKFQFTLLYKERPTATGTSFALTLFQFTLLYKERPVAQVSKVILSIFQFTLLYKERQCHRSASCLGTYFNSRSYIRSDQPTISFSLLTGGNFNSRSYIRSDVDEFSNVTKTREFQFTLLYKERPQSDTANYMTDLFQFTLLYKERHVFR